MACRATDEKRDLLRVVRQPDLTVVYDPKGKLSGRGAYVCATPECIGQAKKQKKLERSLKVSALSEALFADLYARAREGREDGRASSDLPAAPETVPVAESGSNSRVEAKTDLSEAPVEAHGRAREGQESEAKHA